MPKTWEEPGPLKYDLPHESTLLATVNQLITKYGNDPDYRVKSKESSLYDYLVGDLKKVRDEIYAKRSITSEQLQEGCLRLVPSRAKLTKRRPPPEPS